VSKVRVEVFCRQDRINNIPSVCAWAGEVSHVPQKDEFIVIHDGWCSSLVLAVHYNLYDDTVYIEIAPDCTGEYLEKAIELGFEKQKDSSQ
jgi:hypothetical protein